MQPRTTLINRGDRDSSAEREKLQDAKQLVVRFNKDNFNNILATNDLINNAKRNIMIRIDSFENDQYQTSKITFSFSYFAEKEDDWWVSLVNELSPDILWHLRSSLVDLCVPSTLLSSIKTKGIGGKIFLHSL